MADGICGGKRVIRTQSNKKYGLTSQKQKL